MPTIYELIEGKSEYFVGLKDMERKDMINSVKALTSILQDVHANITGVSVQLTNHNMQLTMWNILRN
ncbi:MAG: hypothetical protein AABY14_01090 [Nanoarchaeota archaeon]